MAPVRVKAASVLLLVSVLAVTGGPLFAGRLTHLACAAKHHDCANVAVVTQCCCGDHGDISTPPATMTDPTDVVAAGAVCADAVAVMALSTATHLLPRAADTCPPLSHPSDLPVLFSDLRL